MTYLLGRNWLQAICGSVDFPKHTVHHISGNGKAAIVQNMHEGCLVMRIQHDKTFEDQMMKILNTLRMMIGQQLRVDQLIQVITPRQRRWKVAAVKVDSTPRKEVP